MSPRSSDQQKGTMMKDHSGDIRQYILLSEAWYADANRTEGIKDEVTFGFYSPDGGTSGEMSMRWHVIGELVAPRLECFSDAWHTLAQFKDVIDAMAEVDGQDITPRQFCQLLDHCGFTDATERTR